jgi:hypothetical protein
MVAGERHKNEDRVPRPARKIALKSCLKRQVRFPVRIFIGNASECLRRRRVFRRFSAGKTDAVNWNRGGIDAVRARLSAPAFQRHGVRQS